MNQNIGRPKINGTFIIDGKYMSPADVLHEAGHIIEARQTAMLKRSIEFRSRRTAGEVPEPLGENYKPHEMTLPDRRVELGGDLYTGKVYRDHLGRDAGSEILSTGLEHLYKDPYAFHASDPEFFSFIVNTLRNTHL